MAFRTNKVPAIEERTVSGSSVSFNSAFALPLKACKVSFSATESGTGEKSPSNPYTISGVSAIGLNANSTPVSVSFGDTYYGGYVDVLTGELTVTWGEVDLGDIYFNRTSGDNGYFQQYGGELPNFKKISSYHKPIAIKCELFKTLTTNSYPQEDFGLCVTINSAQLRIRYDAITNVEDFKQAVRGYKLIYELAEPITVQLSPTELSSILGNNTFSTDTGTLEITFADLQEKSASGSVATFNTALAMPLASCHIAVNAWQEGSGDPSPVNNRPIHGWTECNAYQRGINLWDEQYQLGSYATSNGAYSSRTDRLCTLNKIPVSPNTTYYFKTATGITAGNVYYYDINEDYLYNDAARGNNTFTTPSNCHYINIAFGLDYGAVYNNDISINYPLTDTSYHPYDSNSTIYTIQLGQEVYGAEVDVVNGVAHVTHKYKNVGECNFNYYDAQYGAFRSWSIADAKRHEVSEQNAICTNYKEVGRMNASTENNTFCLNSSKHTANSFFIKDNRFTNEQMTQFNEAMNGVYICYELAEPFDIQLTPAQIETIQGNNTIFADTGDVDLTYKDLDIAKRGNFREVFKLPS